MTATAPNISNDRDSPQAEKNYTAVRYGTDKGSIYFGHIHKNADVTAGVMLSTPTGDHQLSLDISGQREGWTCSTSPGNFQVKCGTDPTKLGYEDENLNARMFKYGIKLLLSAARHFISICSLI